MCGPSFDALAATALLESGSDLSEASLPGVSEVLHLGDETVVLHVEAKLAQLVAPQTELLRHGALYCTVLYCTVLYCTCDTAPGVTDLSRADISAMSSASQSFVCTITHSPWDKRGVSYTLWLEEVRATTRRKRLQIYNSAAAAPISSHKFSAAVPVCTVHVYTEHLTANTT